MRSNDDDEAREFNGFLVRWNAGDGANRSGARKGWARRKPVPQWQRDEARDAVEARRGKMRY